MTSGEVPSWLALGDLNNDGSLDVVFIDELGNLGMLLGSSTGTLTLQTPSALDPGPSRIAIGYLEGTTNLDVVATNYVTAGGEFEIFPGNGNGTFGTVAKFPIGDGGTYGVTVADVTGDGKPDIIMAAPYAGVVIYQNMGNGIFQALPVLSPGFTPWAVAVANMYKHTTAGVVDIVVAGGASLGGTGTNYEGEVAVFQGLGAGVFGPATTTYTPAGIALVATTTFGDTHANSLAIVDLNNDGYPDVVTADTGSATISVLLNGGSAKPGILSAAKTYPFSPTPASIDVVSVAAGNFRGGANWDIVATNLGNGTGGAVGVFPGAGNGTFGAMTSVPISGILTYPYAVAVGDMNQDGRPDLVVTGSDGQNVAVFLNACH